jgi:hypothetical protein
MQSPPKRGARLHIRRVLPKGRAWRPREEWAPGPGQQLMLWLTGAKLTEADSMLRGV